MSLIIFNDVVATRPTVGNGKDTQKQQVVANKQIIFLLKFSFLMNSN